MDEINFNHLKRLWNLKLILESGSVKRAAVRANVTSSAISQSITGLEETLGRKVLLRRKNQFVATEYGSELLHAAESAFVACFDLQQNILGNCAVKPKMTWLDFAASESLALELLPELMIRLRVQYPSIRLKVKTGSSEVLTSLVRRGELCMAVVEEPESLKGVMAIPLTTDRLALYTAKREDGRSSGSASIESLGIATLAPGPGGHPRHIAKFIRSLGSSFKPVLTSESYELLRAAAVEGSVVALLPERVAMRRSDELVEVTVPAQNKKPFQAGTYQIFLVSETKCSHEENVFLAAEIKSIIRRH